MKYVFIFLTVFFITIFSHAQNVGIGIITPIEKLHVDSTIKVGKNQTLGPLGRKNLIKFGDDDFVTIGEEVTDDRLYIRYGNLAFMQSSNSIGNGFIGIQTETPGANLDVNGTFRIRGNGAGIGKVLTSDVNGFATWQTFSGGGWSLTGNAGTNPGVNFLGTTDNQPLLFRQNNIYAGQFNYGLRNYFIGNQSGLNTVAPHNIAIGDSALLTNTVGYSNIAIGSGALQHNTNRSGLVAIGDSALFDNGDYSEDPSQTHLAARNTAVGSKALHTNNRGYNNTGVGFEALYKSGGSWSNTAIGAYAMRNGGGFGAEGNVAIGVFALDSVNNFHNTAVGAYSLRRTRSGIKNTGVGHSAMYHNNSGTLNASLGFFAMYGNTSGNTNAAVGASALEANQTGNSNIAIGVKALASSRDRSNLVAIGDSALYNNGTGVTAAFQAIKNTAVGSKALFSNTSGGQNTALGFEAGYSLEQTFYNTAIGALAMRNASGPVARSNVGIGVEVLYTNQGESNVAVGDYTLRSNISGAHNIAIGWNTMYSNNTGDSNTAVGTYALRNNESGDYNTAIGAKALLLNESGNGNVALGNEALYRNKIGNSNVAIGHGALLNSADRSNTVAIGDSALYRNAMGATSNSHATFNTGLGSKALLENTLGFGNTGGGFQSLYANTTGNRNTAFGVYSGNNSPNNTFCTFLGAYAFNSPGGTNYSNSTAIGDGSRISASNQVRVGDGGVTSIGGQVGWTTFSDGRFKKDLEANVPGLAFISQLQPLTYRLKSGEISKALQNEGKDYTEASNLVLSGFVAQDVEAIARKIGYAFSGVDKPSNTEGFYGLRYADFVVPLVKAVQELSSANDTLQQKLDKQQQTIEALEKRLSELEKKSK